MSQPPWPLTTSTASKSRRGAGLPDSRESSGPEDTGRDETGAEPHPIIVFSHLGWDWVWQRPQQFLSRFSRRHRVLFVETYCSPVPQTKVELHPAGEYANVTVLRMHLPQSRWHDGQFIDGERRRALKATLAGKLAGQYVRPLLWFYDPMAVVAFAGQLDEAVIVYDCMDELSQFRGAPPELIERERRLLAVADVVFCGGQKMRRKRLPLNPNTHFYGTGVDVRHFGAALAPAQAAAPDIAGFAGAPVLGYFGVIDERIDYELLAALADARADWQIVMVGPTAKVDPADLPRRKNLHWLGARPYAELPALTKGFSVAMMPFALNAATEYINPTKALEYMAAGRPVVSTALDEVKLNFGKVARIAKSHREFIACCAEEVARPSQSRIARGLKLAHENTWEAIVAKMEGHIADALASTERETATRTSPTRSPSSLTNLAYV